ncbi:hypothetical protein HQO42_05390 [Rhodococcus fascians]|nr:hypothetical protein [Rhodococcus fascians]MBY4236561.1 hypothetical protein [Rhodococcus fascians]MBY4252072.1 hypothetical protein [Rhodococcus fascians]MBY4267907.1 hypothetical protein [Rhodococcus fascians]
MGETVPPPKQSSPAKRPPKAAEDFKKENESVKWVAVIISAVALISSAVTTMVVTNMTNNNARDTVRESAEYLGANQQLNFLRTQRREVYARYDTAENEWMIAMAKFYSEYQPDTIDNPNKPLDMAFRTQSVKYGEVATEAKILAGEEMLAYLDQMTENVDIMTQVIDDSIAIVKADRSLLIDDVMLSKAYSVSDGRPEMKSYDNDSFLQIARREVGN